MIRPSTLFVDLRWICLWNCFWSNTTIGWSRNYDSWVCTSTKNHVSFRWG